MPGKKEIVGVGLAIVAVDIVLWWLGVVTTVPIAWALSGVGIITFLGVLFLGFYAKGAFEKDDVQLAITGSVLAVYFALAPILIFVGVGVASKDLANTFIGNLTAVVEVVIGFYAGGNAVKHAMRAWTATKLTEKEREGLLKTL